MPGTQGGQNRKSDLLELEVQMVMSQYVGVEN